MNLRKKLDKPELMRFLERREIYNGYELVDNNDCPTLQINPSVPSMLIRSISQFAGKARSEINIEDALLFYHAINKISKEVGHQEAKKFRNEHGLSFFGVWQYNLLDYYLKKAAN
jgi:hypothetical protein